MNSQLDSLAFHDINTRLRVFRGKLCYPFLYGILFKLVLHFCHVIVLILDGKSIKWEPIVLS